MEKQTKNMITRKFIEDELRFYNTADIRSTLVVCGSLSLVFVPITFLYALGILSIFENVLIKVILCALGTLFFSAPVWIQLLVLCKSLVERKRLLDGDFDIVTREVTYKQEIYAWRRGVEEFLHFQGFQKRLVDSTTFRLASLGDEFYIVHYRNKKEIKFLYSYKIYEFRQVAEACDNSNSQK